MELKDPIALKLETLSLKEGDILLVSLPPDASSDYIQQLRLRFSSMEALVHLKNVIVFLFKGDTKVEAMSDEMKEHFLKHVLTQDKWKKLAQEELKK